jgi:hypothetical protein
MNHSLHIGLTGAHTAHLASSLVGCVAADMQSVAQGLGRGPGVGVAPAHAQQPRAGGTPAPQHRHQVGVVPPLQRTGGGGGGR